MRMRLQRENRIHAAELGALRTVNWFTHNASLSRIIQLRLLKPTHRGRMEIPRIESRSRQLTEGWQGYLNLQAREEVGHQKEQQFWDRDTLPLISVAKGRSHRMRGQWHSMARNVFALWNAKIMSSNPARGTDVLLRCLCLCSVAVATLRRTGNPSEESY
jgi:hypothetical protein